MAAEDHLSADQFRLYRSEARATGEDLSAPESVGVHWTTRPVDFGWGSRPGYQQRVVWHADVPAEHVHNTDDRYGEGEVVLRRNAVVRLTGRSVTQGQEPYVAVKPGEPHVPMDHDVVIRGHRIAKDTDHLHFDNESL